MSLKPNLKIRLTGHLFGTARPENANTKADTHEAKSRSEPTWFQQRSPIHFKPGCKIGQLKLVTLAYSTQLDNISRTKNDTLLTDLLNMHYFIT